MPSSRGYSSSRWRVARARALARQPRCRVCGATSTLTVHHADELGMLGPRAVDQTNLVVLCRACHAHAHGPNHRTYRG